MGFAHRKLLSEGEHDPSHPQKPPPLPLPIPPPPAPQKLLPLSITCNPRLIQISVASVIGVSILLVIVVKLMKRYCSRRNNSRRRNPPILFGTQEDFLDEDQGPVIDHPIWLIHTVGLQQSVIDSITVCKYKKDEGLIEGTECSVCLGEFEEDESLRLLPKCSHAFHLPCIDTWLRAHKNCPLCRAPIVRDGAGFQVSETESSLSDSSSSQDTQVENHENYGGAESNRFVEGGSSEPVEDSRDSEVSKKSLQEFTSGNSHARVMSNLVDNRRVVEEEVQPVRRSVSLDLSTASVIYHAVANVITDQGNSKSQLVSGKSSNSKIVGKRDGGTSSLCKLVKSSSIGLSLQKGPISMKRSFSSSRKFLSSTHCRSSSSILPL